MTTFSALKWISCLGLIGFFVTTSFVYGEEQMMITTNQNETYYLPEGAPSTMPSQIGTGVTDEAQMITLPAAQSGDTLYPQSNMTHSIAESILASDDRIAVKDTTKFPYSATVFILTKFPNGTFYTGSGSMVSSDGVLTAGHMIYSQKNGGWAQTVTVYPGLNGHLAPFGSANAAKLFSVEAWTKNQDSTHDIGLIRLDTPIGYKTGWFGSTTTIMPNETIQTNGFPGEKAETMWQTTGIIDAIEDTIVHYTLDTTSGQSGSPVYNTQKQLVATHTYGGQQDNFGTRLNATILSWIDSETHSFVANFRLYNPNSGEHFYTKNAAEYAHLTTLGWRAEGIAWFSPSQGTAVYRVYNPNSGMHFYTTSVAEKTGLIRLGWRDEGIAYQVSASGSPVYRVYNKHDGRHFYTSSASERNGLVALGWRNEGIAWYGL